MMISLEKVNSFKVESFWVEGAFRTHWTCIYALTVVFIA